MRGRRHRRRFVDDRLVFRQGLDVVVGWFSSASPAALSRCPPLNVLAFLAVDRSVQFRVLLQEINNL